MKLFKSCFILIVIVGIINAGEIFGTVFDPNGKPLTGVKMVLKDSGILKDSTFLDEDGEYTLYKNEAGTCTIEVLYDGEKIELNANSYKDPVRYNLNIQKQADGSYLIIRR